MRSCRRSLNRGLAGQQDFHASAPRRRVLLTPQPLPCALALKLPRLPFSFAVSWLSDSIRINFRNNGFRRVIDMRFLLIAAAMILHSFFSPNKPWRKLPRTSAWQQKIGSGQCSRARSGILLKFLSAGKTLLRKTQNIARSLATPSRRLGRSIRPSALSDGGSAENRARESGYW